MRVLMVGLDAAGKTSFLYRLKTGDVVTTIPTIGFNVETVEHKNISFTAWDVGGRDKIRPLWRHYYANTQALIFVVDSNDRDRIDDSRDYNNSAKEELNRVLAEDELRDALLLVIANKQDLSGCMKVQEVTERLGLNRLRNRPWHIVAASTLTGEGIAEGMDWLASKGKAKQSAAAAVPAVPAVPRSTSQKAATVSEKTSLERPPHTPPPSAPAAAAAAAAAAVTGAVPSAKAISSLAADPLPLSGKRPGQASGAPATALSRPTAVPVSVTAPTISASTFVPETSAEGTVASVTSVAMASIPGGLLPDGELR